MTELRRAGAFASGPCWHAPGLDHPYPTAAPGTGSSTFSFSLLPWPELSQALEHVKGKVAIGAVFIRSDRRQRKPCLPDCRSPLHPP